MIAIVFDDRDSFVNSFFWGKCSVFVALGWRNYMRKAMKNWRRMKKVHSICGEPPPIEWTRYKTIIVKLLLFYLFPASFLRNEGKNMNMLLKSLTGRSFRQILNSGKSFPILQQILYALSITNLISQH